MRAKSFLYVSLGILALALAYHFGASTATAQAPGNSVVAMMWNPTSGGYAVVVTANGDAYTTGNYGTWFRGGNVFSGSTPVAQQTFGQLKAQYRK